MFGLSDKFLCYIFIIIITTGLFICGMGLCFETVRAAEPTPTITPPPMASEYADTDETLTDEEAEGLGFFASFWDGLVHLIIPRNEFFSNEFDKLDERLKEKLPYVTYVTTIGRLKDATSFYEGEEYENGGVDFSDRSVGNTMSIVARFVAETGKPFFDYFRPVIYGLYIFFLLHYNYGQIEHVLTGAKSQAGIDKRLDEQLDNSFYGQ